MKCMGTMSRWCCMLFATKALFHVTSRMVPSSCRRLQSPAGNMITWQSLLKVFSTMVGMERACLPILLMGTQSGARNDSDYKYLARHEVCGGIEDFCAATGRLLKHGGHFVCVFRPDRLSSLMGALSAHHLEPKRVTFVHADEHTEPSMVLVDAIKGGAEGLRVSAPLILHDAAQDGGTRPLSARARNR